MVLSSRRRLILLLTLALLCGLGSLRLLWQWKVPGLLERRIERLTGHRATVAAVGITHRLELVAYDVRIAGAPPFEAQTMARADRAIGCEEERCPIRLSFLMKRRIPLRNR